ncbi:hypothetical protein [Acidiphilium sp. MT5]
MSCINPIAPLGDMACASPALSALITAHIHAAGMLKRAASAVINFANGAQTGDNFALIGRAVSACADDAINAKNTAPRATIDARLNDVVAAASPPLTG